MNNKNIKSRNRRNIWKNDDWEFPHQCQQWNQEDCRLGLINHILTCYFQIIESQK